MKKFLREFKEFALKGNVMDMAVGIIIGGAFTGIVKSLIENFINPVIMFVTGGAVYSKSDVAGFAFAFLGEVINFILLAFILFLLVKGVSKMMAVGKKQEAEVPTKKECPFCKSEVAIEATRCPFCTSHLTEEKAEA